MGQTKPVSEWWCSCGGATGGSCDYGYTEPCFRHPRREIKLNNLGAIEVLVVVHCAILPFAGKTHGIGQADQVVGWQAVAAS